MPELAFSAFLEANEDFLRSLVDELAGRFDYVSLLGTDDSGLSFSASPGETGASSPMWVQRGFVLRAQSSGRIAETAFNVLEPRSGLARLLGSRLEDQFRSASGSRSYPPLPDEPAADSMRGHVALDPFAADPAGMLSRLAACRDALLAKSDIVSARARADFVRVSRLFFSPRRSLKQSFMWSQAYIFGVLRKGDLAKSSYRSASGLLGLEVLDALEAQLPDLVGELRELLGAVKIEPGEYEVILTPDVAGTLAHEAFGHGVETDMFVKRRAKAVEFLGKGVASPLVTMYDGAKGVEQTGSFLFDDEGNLATKTTVIDAGILVSGFSDALSALALGTAPTGNGRRQAYDHKAYARMTNTYFAPGASSLDAMVAATRRGWLVDRLDSGMEDPKNWGIQLIALIGREIVDGAFTGRVASPVYCSGYVPEVLSAIDMVSGDFSLSGSGACGKGYKEFVKVSAGGPYVRTRMRLG